MMRMLATFSLSCVVFFFELPIAQSSNAKIKTEEIKGYITQINSPTSFEIEDYKMSLDGKYDVELQNVESKAIKFDPQVHLRVGTLVKIKTKVNTDTLEGEVEEMKIDVKQFRKLSHTTILDSIPTDLVKSEQGKWTGIVLADARRILIRDSTDVRFKLNKSEEREAKEKKKSDGKKNEGATETDTREADSKVENQSDDDDFAEEASTDELQKDAKPLESLAQIGPGVYMTYKGVENLDGSVVASDVVFVRNEKTKQEKEMWKDLRIKEKESAKANSFDMLKVGDKKYKVLQDDSIQDFIRKLGDDLIPDYQKQMTDEDENKIPFKFVVVFDKSFNASAYPTGTVVIHHEVFNQLENEAQLVAILSHEIAHATQEHGLRQRNYKKKTRTGLFIGRIAAYATGAYLLGDILSLTEAAIVNGYSRSLENQSDRIGMAIMIKRGYDPREAPRVWKLMSLVDGDDSSNFFWSSHSSNAERRSYLMLTIRNTYPNLNFSDLKKDSDEFQKIAATIREKYPSKSKRRAL